MDNIVLQAEPRRTGRHALRELRVAERVPAVIYGPGIEPQTVAVNSKDLHKVLVAAGAGLITLQIGDGAPVRVLAREVQRNPIRHHPVHVDFLAVSMTEKLRLNVPIAFEGIAPALGKPELVMVRNMDTVEIECLPTDIPNHLTANLSNLKTEEDSVHVRDLQVPAGVRILTDGDHVVVSLTLARAAALEEEAVEAPSADEVEVVTKGKKEEEE